MFKLIESSIKRKLTTHEKETISDVMHKVRNISDPMISIDLATHYYLSKIIESLKSKTIIEDPDEEYTQRFAQISKFLGCKSASDLSKKMNIASGLKYNYVLIDSNNAEISSDRTKLKWLLNDKGIILSVGYINLHSILRNIRAMRLGRAQFADLDITNLNYIRSKDRIAFGFEELVSQCFLHPNGFRFQFSQFLPDDKPSLAYDSTNPYMYGPTVTLSPFTENHGWFDLKPITKLDSLTLRMMDLRNKQFMTILDGYGSTPGIQHIGVIVVNGVPYTNPITIAGVGIAPADPYSATGVLLPSGTYDLSGFTTDNPVVDAALITSYNQRHTLTFLDNEYVGYPEMVSNSYYNPPIDVSGGTYVAISIPITITYIYKPRLTVALEILSEDNIE